MYWPEIKHSKLQEKFRKLGIFYVVKWRFFARSLLFFLASFSSLIFWFKNLILMKVRVRTYFLTTSKGTDLTLHKMFWTVVSLTLCWELRPFFPWISLKTSSKRPTCFRKSSDGRVRPPRERALIQGEFVSPGLDASLVLQPSSGYFWRNLWAKNPATYLRPSVEQSNVWEESNNPASLLESLKSWRADKFTSSAEMFGSSYSASSEMDWRIWKDRPRFIKWG